MSILVQKMLHKADNLSKQSNSDTDKSKCRKLNYSLDTGLDVSTSIQEVGSIFYLRKLLQIFF